jgi:hypothetical protein
MALYQSDIVILPAASMGSANEKAPGRSREPMPAATPASTVCHGNHTVIGKVFVVFAHEHLKTPKNQMKSTREHREHREHPKNKKGGRQSLHRPPFTLRSTLSLRALIIFQK